MVDLYLDNTLVVIDNKTNIKVIKENPYFTSSDTYTLDVTLPMSIMANKLLFGNLQRLDHNKSVKTMSAKLVVNNHMIINGTAKITTITDLSIKVQLTSGNSEINFLSSENNIYIDELDFGTTPRQNGVIKYRNGAFHVFGDITKYVFMQVYDETNSKFPNYTIAAEGNSGAEFYTYRQAVQPNLLYVFQLLMKYFGYSIVENDFNTIPWNHIFVCSAKGTHKIASALPHWTAKVFIEHLCNFFNATLIADANTKTCRLKSNMSFFDKSKYTIIPEDEYSSEVEDEEDSKSLASSNVKYDVSSSQEHDYDVLSDDIREGVAYKDYNSFEELVAAYNALSDDEKKKYIYTCPTGEFIWWSEKKDESDAALKRVGHFEPIIRDSESTEYLDLKICPVAIGEQGSVAIDLNAENPYPPIVCFVPSLENPTADDMESTDDVVSVMDYINGNSEINKAEKEDRMQVMFVDNILQTCPFKDDASRQAYLPMAFTDFVYKYTSGIDADHHWSLALKGTDADYYIGQLHNNNYKFNTKILITIKFLSNNVPDPTSIFIIHNKRFGCKKLEFSIDAKGVKQEITGYFYEMTNL